MSQLASAPASSTASPARPNGVSRRRFLKTFGLGAALLTATAGYGYEVGAKHLALEQVTLKIKGLAARWEGKRIVQLSDLHASPSVDPRLIHQAFAMAQSCDPEFICVTGDWVTRDCAQFDHLQNAVAPVVENTPIIGTLGNHDFGSHWKEIQIADEITRRLRRMGVNILRNTIWRPYDGAGELCMVGLDDLWAGAISPLVVVNAPLDSSVIVLSHNPDTYDMIKPFRWHAMLSGHTHGGQVIVPGMGPIKVPVEHKNRYAGAYFPDNSGRMLYINRGIGTTAIHLRLNCPPEVTCFTLRSA